jgi:murein DD-endopeptidase MepM/ murein hydrolase activator NlpD
MVEVGMGDGRRRWRAAARALLATVALLGLLAAPAAAAVAAALDPAVAEQRAEWSAAEAGVEDAVALADELAAALADAEAAEREAAALADAETAALVQRERDLERAEEALHTAEVEATAAHADLRGAIAAYERALAAARQRRVELQTAAASIYAQGDPRVQAVDGLVHALDQSANVSEFLAATERLTYVTRDARARLDGAAGEVDDRGDDALVAAEVLARRRAAEAAALAARDTADGAAQAQRARRDAALEALDAAGAHVDGLRDELVDAEAALVEARDRLTAALTGLQGLGWRAGVPGPHGLAWPIDGRPGSGFGPRLHPIHNVVRPHQGVDVGAPTGQPVVAAAAGVVAHAGPRGGYGITVIIDHGAGLSTLYAHLSALDVRQGQSVNQAQLIGRAGSTGQSTGPHLHFEVRDGGRPQDPMRYYR